MEVLGVAGVMAKVAGGVAGARQTWPWYISVGKKWRGEKQGSHWVRILEKRLLTDNTIRNFDTHVS